MEGIIGNAAGGEHERGNDPLAGNGHGGKGWRRRGEGRREGRVNVRGGAIHLNFLSISLAREEGPQIIPREEEGEEKRQAAVAELSPKAGRFPPSWRMPLPICVEPRARACDHAYFEERDQLSLVNGESSLVHLACWQQHRTDGSSLPQTPTEYYIKG